MSDVPPMRRRDEDSPQGFEASIEKADAWSSLLARACQDAAQAPLARALEVVLQRLREAAGAERAFLLEASSSPRRARVVADDR